MTVLPAGPRLGPPSEYGPPAWPMSRFLDSNLSTLPEKSRLSSGSHSLSSAIILHSVGCKTIWKNNFYFPFYSYSSLISYSRGVDNSTDRVYFWLQNILEYFNNFRGFKLLQKVSLTSRDVKRVPVISSDFGYFRRF